MAPQRLHAARPGPQGAPCVPGRRLRAVRRLQRCEAAGSNAAAPPPSAAAPSLPEVLADGQLTLASPPPPGGLAMGPPAAAGLLQQQAPKQRRRQQHAQQQQQHAPHQHHPVLRVIQSRLQHGSCDGRPGQRRDGFKLGLVVEGGGMRGIVTGAMLMGLQDMGLTGVFDAVYGASAGAINATYFLSGQPEGLDIYTDHLASDGRFLSLKRYFRAPSGCRPAMDIDYLIDDLMCRTVPLDWEAVRASELPLKVVASSLTTLRAEVLGNFADRADLAECLKASANVPEIVGGPRRHRGHDLVDAAVFEPLPVKAALRDGCTHVLALCSRPMATRPAWSRHISALLTGAIKWTLLNPPYMRDAWRVEPLHSTHRGQPLDDLLVQLVAQGRALELDDLLDSCGTGASSPGIGNSPTSSADGADGAAELSASTAAICGHVFPVHPGPAAAFAPICTHVATLRAGRQEGYRSVLNLSAALQRVAASAGAPAPLV